MNLTSLPKTVAKSQKRVGRGYGSGRGGHTSTRGAKGQKARGKVGLFFQGTKTKKSLIKRLPLVRGKGKMRVSKKSAIIVNLKYLNLFKKDEKVNLDSLQDKGILPKILPEGTMVKILGEGEIGVPLEVLLPTSKGAKEKIEKAGGKVTGRKETPSKPVKEEKKEVRKTKKSPKPKEQ